MAAVRSFGGDDGHDGDDGDGHDGHDGDDGDDGLDGLDGSLARLSRGFYKGKYTKIMQKIGRIEDPNPSKLAQGDLLRASG